MSLIDENRFDEIFKPVSETQLSPAEIESHNDYQRGMADCENDVKHHNQSEAYNQGYAFQYAYEQVRGASNGS